MDMILLMGLLLVTVVGFLVGCVVGFVLGHDIAQAHQEHDTDLRVDVWREDIDNPEGYGRDDGLIHEGQQRQV